MTYYLFSSTVWDTIIVNAPTDSDGCKWCDSCYAYPKMFGQDFPGDADVIFSLGDWLYTNRLILSPCRWDKPLEIWFRLISEPLIDAKENGGFQKLEVALHRQDIEAFVKFAGEEGLPDLGISVSPASICDIKERTHFPELPKGMHYETYNLILSHADWYAYQPYDLIPKCFKQAYIIMPKCRGGKPKTAYPSIKFLELLEEYEMLCYKNPDISIELDGCVEHWLNGTQCTAEVSTFSTYPDGLMHKCPYGGSGMMFNGDLYSDLKRLRQLPLQCGFRRI